MKKAGPRLTAALALALACQAAGAHEIKIFASRVTKIALQVLGPDYEKASGNKLVVIDDVAVVMKRRIEAGEAFDLAVLVDYQTDDLVKTGHLVGDTRTTIMHSGTGVAVRRGAPKPDISTVEAFRKTMLDAKSITYLAEGASTTHVARAFEKLGIAAALKPKTTLVPTDTVSERVAEGKEELGIGIIANIVSVPGVELIGPFPAELQFNIVFSGAISKNTQHAQDARDILKLLTSPKAAEIIAARGMQPG
ncbi:MAG: molybdate transporter, periplasmic molybdate-binding protein [Betaproteobacteria bacterium]|nr:molybdate transporter, periplasmic molybdate-binding protein [Betaproteobacteria bacterium]